MRITLLGPGSDSLRGALNAAEIEYEDRPYIPRPGVIVAAGDDFLEIAGDAAIWRPLALVLHEWLLARISRSIKFTTRDNRIIDAQGLTVVDIERVLRMTKLVDALDVEKPSTKK